MPFKVQVGPPQIAIHQAMTVLVTEPDGQVQLADRQGPVFLRHPADQRLERLCQRRAVGPAERRRRQLRRRAHLPDQPRLPHRGRRGRRRIRSPSCSAARSTAGCTRTSTSPTTASGRCASTWRSPSARDFADIFEVKAGRTVRRGRITTEWSEAQQRLRTHLPQPRLHARASRCRSAQASVARRLRQRPAQLRGRPGARRDLALPACSTTWPTASATSTRRTPAPQHARRSRHAGGAARLAADGAEDPHQQRGILPLLPPGDRRHGGAAPADRGHRPHGVRARRRPALVRGAVRPRQPDRVAAEHPGLSGIRARRAGRARPLAGDGTRRLSRRRARQDHARTALRRAGAFQADPAHAVLRHRRRHAAVSDHAARRLARHRRHARCCSAICRMPRRPGAGSTTTATATATASRNTRRARRSATRTWAGRMPAIRWSIPTARW